jgi:hypothetical protein
LLKVAEKIKSYFVFSNFFQKIVPFMKNVEEYGGSRKATNDNRVWGMRFAHWISKATRACTRPCARSHKHTPRTRAHTHTNTVKYVILIACHRKRGL